jgi:hypothetical protein
MANPTTNFGWQMPTSTDLVTDLPADFEVFGQAVDTALVDLKGGTTGQVLSKASNTNMDFTWVTTDDANAIQNSIVDAKGDIVAASANDTPARLAVGNNGETLVADSSTSTGLRYTENYAAGKNAIINGAFNVWQRGTSFTITTSGLTYTADRWYSHIIGATVGCTVSQQTFTPGTAPVSGYESQFFIRQNVTTLTSQSIQALAQRIEDVRTFANQTVTVSFWAKADASRNYTSRFVQNFGSGGSSEVATSTGATHALTTSWQRFTVSVTVPSVSGKTIGTSSYLAILLDGPSNTANTLDVWGFQVEDGSVATAFQTATGTLQGELAACQRYYLDTRNGTDQPFSGYSNSTDYLLANVRYPVTMRTTPSVTIGQSSGANYVRRISTNAQVAITVTSYPGTNPGGFSAVYAVAAPFVAAVGYDFYILASAEL